MKTLYELLYETDAFCIQLNHYTHQRGAISMLFIIQAVCMNCRIKI